MPKQTIEFECPHCHHNESLEVETSIQPGRDEELYQALLRGDLFLHKCESCQNIIHLTYPLLLHDHNAKKMCFYVPNEEDIESTVQSILAAKNTENGQKMSDYEVRIVSNDRQLQEKALIWSKGEDDKALEMLKLTYLYQVVSHNEDFEADDSCYRHSDQGDQIDFYQEGNYLGSVDCDLSLLDDIKNRFLSRDTGVEESDWIVDLGWAMNHLTNLLHRPDDSEEER